MNNTIPVITIDGPSAAGKSTLSKAIANELNWFVLESGIIYRLIALLVLKKNIFISEKNVFSIVKNINFSFLKNNVFMHYNYVDMNLQIVSNIASKIANFYSVRKILLSKQRDCRVFPGLIAEGRDMGTVVFPDATIKFFLHANLETRVYRRMIQLKKNGCFMNFKKLFGQIQMRDERDQYRFISPLYPSKNAIILDSTNISISEIVKMSMMYILKKMKI